MGFLGTNYYEIIKMIDMHFPNNCYDNYFVGYIVTPSKEKLKKYMFGSPIFSKKEYHKIYILVFSNNKLYRKLISSSLKKPFEVIGDLEVLNPCIDKCISEDFEYINISLNIGDASYKCPLLPNIYQDNDKNFNNIQ